MLVVPNTTPTVSPKVLGLVILHNKLYLSLYTGRVAHTLITGVSSQDTLLLLAAVPYLAPINESVPATETSGHSAIFKQEQQEQQKNDRNGTIFKLL